MINGEFLLFNNTFQYVLDELVLRYQFNKLSIISRKSYNSMDNNDNELLKKCFSYFMSNYRRFTIETEDNKFIGFENLKLAYQLYNTLRLRNSFIDQGIIKDEDKI